MDALGLRLVRALITEGQPARLVERGITDLDIQSEAREAYRWATDFHSKRGKWPTSEQITENTKIELPTQVEDLSYVCDLVRKRKLAKALERAFKDSMTSLESRDPDEALRVISEAIAAQQKQNFREVKPRFFRKGGLNRSEEYDLLKSEVARNSIATPWPALNDAIREWAKGQLHVILAMANVGKSWASCIIADHAMMQGKKVLVVTLEMSSIRIERRIDAVHYKLPWGEFRDNELDLFSELRWRDELRKGLLGSGDIITVDKQIVQYVSDVNALVTEHEPDLVIVDGGYRFSAKNNSGDWESSKQIVADLQTSAEASEIPWVVTTQQGEVPPGSKMAGKERAYRVKYAKEWIINPDIAIEMHADEDLFLLKQMEWRILRERDSKGEGGGAMFVTNWNLQTMDFSQQFDNSALTAPVSTGITY